MSPVLTLLFKSICVPNYQTVFRYQCFEYETSQTSVLSLFFCFWFSELVDTARKALIWRVVELTDDRFTLQLEVSSLQETVSRLEGRIKEKEEEAKRCGINSYSRFHDFGSSFDSLHL